ncbi:MAG: pyridoxal 5'-phosphate synthase glutaminase subunit PdxT [Acidobacteria bacterium]|nr:pyridoxal 5'-phosphate synthase glutaminase subunit PdxT [Acidobacteriota bacterium]
MAFGVLALQGDFAAHAAALRALGVGVRDVRRCRDLDGLSGLVLPGGESTTLLKLMADEPWFDALARFHGEGGALFGTCAGAILLAREVRGPAQPSLGLLDAVVERNAYGRQVESFETTLDAPALGGSIGGVFIRAPRLRALGPAVEVLARHDGEPVLVREGSVLAATFHPEIAGEARVHRLFVESARAAVVA